MIKVQQEDFNIQDEIDKLCDQRTDIGAVASFIGLVRSINNTHQQEPDIHTLYLEHYPAMTKKALMQIVKTATDKWQLQNCSVIHRIGYLKPAENIVLVLCAAKQRISALQACEFIIHSLKTQAPFWKKEYYTDGSEKWVEQRLADKELALSLIPEKQA